MPAIVEAAESSANAAKDAAARIRKYLSNPAKSQGPAQYNAIMLTRILSENPGHTFTRNFDAKFVNTIKDLLREGRDMAAQAMLRETLDMFESQKPLDTDLSGLINMWKKEKKRASKYARPVSVASKWRLGMGVSNKNKKPPAQGVHFQPSAFPRHPPAHQRQMPPPDELAARVAEARTSGNLLIQLAQTTPSAEVPSNELMREFSERCSAAARSIQTYMAVENPPPDEDTLLTLIETNEHLSVALSKYQRAVLNARKAAGITAADGTSNGIGNVIGTGTANSSSPSPVEEARQHQPPPSAYREWSVPLPGPPPGSAAAAATTAESLSSPSTPPPQNLSAANRYQYNPNEFRVENPFADRSEDPHVVSPIEARSTRE